MNKIIVFGGTGFVGKNLQKIKPEWHYIGSNDVDLTCSEKTFNYIENESPDAIIHLAARVGGIKANTDYPEFFYYENASINLNVVCNAVDLKIPRLLASLSICAFPDIVRVYPFDESYLHEGSPYRENIPYGYSKRALHVHLNAARKQYGLNYSSFTPSNLYGPHNNFDLETSHFVPAMIKIIHKAKDGDTVEFWGTGKPLRQFMFVEDLVKAIPVLLEKHNSELPIIVAPYENLSIKEMIDIMLEITNKDIKIKFNGHLDGQFRKDGNNSKFMEIYKNFTFTPFKEGLKKTYEWYKHNLKKGENYGR